MAAGFKITRGGGFHITFENGVVVSVQFHWGNYCENYMKTELEFQVLKELQGTGPDVESRDAEIAIWDRNNQWITGQWPGPDNDYPCHDDQVIGYLTAKDVLHALNWAASQ